MAAKVSQFELAKAKLMKGLDLGNRGDSDLLDRFERWGQDLLDGLSATYDLNEIVSPLVEIMLNQHKNRSEELRQRDRERVLNPDWFQRPDAIGYVCYTDLFDKNLAGLANRIDYLKKLKVSYLHLLPILEPRPGESDGGYAVKNYRALRADLGTMEQLAAVADQLHESGISLTLDLVLNHVAMEHEWAEKAKAGDAKYRDYFYAYDSREIPDQFERSLPEVFPDFAPGNFTWNEELKAWVWTTFNSYQWDVNWANPAVFCEFADIIANLANHGVDCIRLDAIAFIWKRMGTSCQGEPEVHTITQAMRAFSKILTPSMIYKAEAIVGPAQVGAYLGEGPHAGKVSDMAYHNSLMVQIWSAIAAKDAKLLELVMSRFGSMPASTAWGVYLRCHDDIGWAIDDTDAHRIGINGHDHRMFLADYYTGKFYGSEARGVDFQIEKHSGERRTSGTAAALTGIQGALDRKDKAAVNTAINRYLCAYAMVFGFGGIPLLYMGDEIALFNDDDFKKDKTKRDDNRWIHRPSMPWDVAEDAAAGKKPTSTATKVRKGMENLINTRLQLPSLHASVATKVRAGQGQGVAIFERVHPAGNIVQIYNLAETRRWISRDELGALNDEVTDHLTQRKMNLGEGFELEPYQALWLG